MPRPAEDCDDMPSLLQRIKCWSMRRLGFRGITLVGIGLYHISFGMHLQEGVRAPINPDQVILFEIFLPYPVRIVAWLALGALITLAGLLPRLQPLGFAVALAMPAERAISYLWSWFHWVAPGHPGGAPDAGWLTMRWLLIIGMIILAGQWREGPERIKEIRQGGP